MLSPTVVVVVHHRISPIGHSSPLPSRHPKSIGSGCPYGWVHAVRHKQIPQRCGGRQGLVAWFDLADGDRRSGLRGAGITFVPALLQRCCGEAHSAAGGCVSMRSLLCSSARASVGPVNAEAQPCPGRPGRLAERGEALKLRSGHASNLPRAADSAPAAASPGTAGGAPGRSGRPACPA